MERIKTVGTITGVLLLACGILNFTVGIGTIYIGFQQTAQILWQIFQGTANGNILADVIYYLRLPRLVLAAVVGYGLSITGCVMQAVMRNSLADPYLLGISSGAGLGAVIAIILGFTSVAGFDAIGCFAFLGAFAVTIFIVLLSLRFGKSGTTAILLSGMALNAVCAAGISLLISIYADAERIQSVTFWLMGSLQTADWRNTGILLAVVFFISLYFVKNSRILNLMLLGDEVSVTLGYDLSKMRRIYILLCALIVGLIVYNCGIIGFVGLVIPHIARLLCGGNYKKVLPMSAVIGMLFMVCADVISRTIMEGSEVPIGVVVSVIGAPIFIYLLISKNYGYGKKKKNILSVVLLLRLPAVFWAVKASISSRQSSKINR